MRAENGVAESRNPGLFTTTGGQADGGKIPLWSLQREHVPMNTLILHF